MFLFICFCFGGEGCEGRAVGFLHVESFWGPHWTWTILHCKSGLLFFSLLSLNECLVFFLAAYGTLEPKSLPILWIRELVRRRRGEEKAEGGKNTENRVREAKGVFGIPPLPTGGFNTEAPGGPLPLRRRERLSARAQRASASRSGLPWRLPYPEKSHRGVQPGAELFINDF